MDESLHQMCRTCLGTGVALMSLHVNSGTSQTCTVAEMLGKFTTVLVSESDGLPSKVCLSCVSEIKRSYFFKIKCESSQDTLQQYLKEVSSVPEEPIVASAPHLKQDTPKQNEIYIETYQVTGTTIKPVTNENNEIVISGQVAEILASNNYNDDEMLEDQQENDERIKAHVVNDENYENNENQETYEFNDYLENSSDDGSQQERIIIIGCEDCCLAFETKEEFQAHAANCNNEKSLLIATENKKDDNESNVGKRKRRGHAAKQMLKKCPDCPMDFVHQKNLEKHMKKCHPSLDNSENEDQIELSTTTELKTDEESSDSDSNDNEKESIETDTLPEDSILKHDPTLLPSGEFTCERCGAGFVNKKSLQCHMKINKCTVKQFICKFCGKVFINDKSLIDHIKTHAKTFKCAKCPKSFSNAEKLQAHVEKVHNSNLKNQCPFCAKVFTMYSTLKDHLRIHSGEKPFLCSICGKGFSQNTNLKQHLMRHKNLKPFACKFCNVSFVSKGELNAHVRKHTGDHPFQCDICTSAFTTSSSLVKHKRIHTGERPYACDLCPMRFSALGTLKNHRRTHTGEKPFQCKYCSRSFAQKSDCVTHMRSHTGERPYTCSICGWGFPQSGTLKTHMKTHEKEKRREKRSMDSVKESDQEQIVESVEMDIVKLEDFI